MTLFEEVKEKADTHRVRYDVRSCHLCDSLGLI
jgi:hypothetical protein